MSDIPTPEPTTTAKPAEKRRTVGGGGKRSVAVHEDDLERDDGLLMAPSYDYEADEAAWEEEREEYGEEELSDATIEELVAKAVAAQRTAAEERAAAQLAEKRRHLSQQQQQAGGSPSSRLSAEERRHRDAVKAELLAEMERLGFVGVGDDDHLLEQEGALERLRAFVEARREVAASVYGCEDADDGMAVQLTSTAFVGAAAVGGVLAIPSEVLDIVSEYAEPMSTIALASSCHSLRVSIEATGFWQRLRKAGTVRVGGRFVGPAGDEEVAPTVDMEFVVKHSVPPSGKNLWEDQGNTTNRFQDQSTRLPAPVYAWSEFWSFWQFVWNAAPQHAGWKKNGKPEVIDGEGKPEGWAEFVNRSRREAKFAAFAAADEIRVLAWLDLYATADGAVREYARLEANRHSGMAHVALRVFDGFDWGGLPDRVARRLGAPRTEAERASLRSLLEVATIGRTEECERDVSVTGDLEFHERDADSSNAPTDAVVNERNSKHPVLLHARREHRSSAPNVSLTSRQERLVKQFRGCADGEMLFGGKWRSIRTPDADSRFFGFFYRPCSNHFVPYAHPGSMEPYSNYWMKAKEMPYARWRHGVMSEEEFVRGLLPYNVQVERTARGSVVQ